MTIPNLAGVATKDLVETIGTGKFKAAYINWSRTLNLLRTHAPGWTASCITADDGGLLHRAPVGAYLLIQFVHFDGTETPAVPQAVMDNRNNAIPYDKITARDITDTQRRGTCLAASFVFGLAYELWAKLPLESGYGDSANLDAIEAFRGSAAPKAPVAPAATQAAPAVASGGTSEVTEATFREAALEKGVHTVAIDAIVKKLDGKWAAGIKTLAAKSADELNKAYGPADPADGEEY